jgi:antitoxin HicB
MSQLPEKLSFRLVFEPEPEGGYTVTVPALPPCITYGATFEEASANAREAIILCLEDMLANGETIPLETQFPVLSSVEFSSSEIHA